VPEKLSAPIEWKKPRRIFVNSMSDLFHPSVPDSYIRQVADVMLSANWHTFQVLTKRSERLRVALESYLKDVAACEHIWWGVSVEDKKYGVPRIEDLRRSPAKVRFLSVEPLLEDVGQVNLEKIHWVIVGGESGPKARNMQEPWVSSLRDQCLKAKVSFFFKQWGGPRKHKTGRELQGRTYDAFPILD
jgi:protein gp37